MRRFPTILALLLLAGCKGEPEKISSPKLVGSWKSEFDNSILTCEETGIFTLTFAIPKTRAVVGDYSFDGKVATFRNRPETKVCVDETGTYDIKIDDATLIARKVKDSCTLREKQMDHPWTRVQGAAAPKP
ncbi:MAG: hypothetical protein K8R92_04430 [Planctomycetes bacterium]|nr:hypothetical protein [Planctomycetota bacterium]